MLGADKVSQSLRSDIYRRARGLPVDAQGAAVSRFVIRDGEVFHRRGQFRDIHVDARQFVALILVRDSPFSSFLVDDESPLVSSGDGEERVAPGGHGLAANHYVAAGYEGRRFIRTGAPHLAERDESSKNLATLHTGTGIVRLYSLASPEIAGRGSGWAGFLAGSENGESENQSDDRGDSFLHGLSLE